MGDGGGQVASGQNDALIKGKVARQRRRLGTTTTTGPGQTPSVGVVGVASSDGKHGEGVEEEREGGRDERERVLSWWEGQLGKVVAISFLGKSPDSCSVNARPPTSVKNRRDDKGQGRCVSSNLRPCLLPGTGGRSRLRHPATFAKISEILGRKTSGV